MIKDIKNFKIIMIERFDDTRSFAHDVFNDTRTSHYY